MKTYEPPSCFSLGACAPFRPLPVSGECPQAVTYVISMPEEMSKAKSTKDDTAADEGKKNKRKPRNQQQLFHRETGDVIGNAAARLVARSVEPIRELG